MNIIVTNPAVPFVYGGAEILAHNLAQELSRAGHTVEICSIPFRWYPPEKILDHMLACRLLDLQESNGRKVDLLIGLGFPAYLVEHSRKVFWVVHQHRQAYDLWQHPLGDIHKWPNGCFIRDAIRSADIHSFTGRKVFTISKNVSERMRKYCAVESEAIYHPPQGADRFSCGESGDYLFAPSRVSEIKRQNLILEALTLTRSPIKVHFAGKADNDEYLQKLQHYVGDHAIQDKVVWLNVISEEEKYRQYANALGVLFIPIDEDYGYITLEAMLSGKPVITCTDSGGPLEFIVPGDTGMVVPPDPAALAEVMDVWYYSKEQCRALGRKAREHYHEMNIGWGAVLERMLS